MYDTRCLCRWKKIFKKRVQRWNRIDGIKALACGIPGTNKRIKFVTTSDRGLICLFSQNDTTILVFQNVQFEFWQVFRHYYLLGGHPRSLHYSSLLVCFRSVACLCFCRFHQCKKPGSRSIWSCIPLRLSPGLSLSLTLVSSRRKVVIGLCATSIIIVRL